MSNDASPSAPVMSHAELQVEIESHLHGIGRRFGVLPQEKDELLRLLEEANTWLCRVGQSPNDGMHYILWPIMAVLIKNELIEHPDPNVNVVVVSCLTEIIRITAPYGPYDDDAMKNVFKKIVETFAKLDDMNNPCFARRVSILASIAGDRCFVMMLDLNLDHLILDMFRHFFKTVSTRHSQSIINYMETIMIHVIQESDDVHDKLASCLLQNLTRKTQEILPASFGLAKRVLDQCKDKLKPVLLELLKGTPLDDYINVVMLLQDASHAGEFKSRKYMPTEGKFVEKSISTKASIEPIDTKSIVAKPKQDQSPTLKSEEKNYVRNKQGSNLQSAKINTINDSGLRATGTLNKDNDIPLSAKAAEGESSKKKHESSMKLQKEDVISDKDIDKDNSLKEAVSPTKMDKSKGQQEDIGGSKRKCLHEVKEVTPSRKNKFLNENLVGSRIKVWWPHDKMFYEGVVESFDASSKRHKVSYDDGDVEVLMLRKERWELITEEQDDPNVASNMPHDRRGNERLGKQMKEGKKGTP